MEIGSTIKLGELAELLSTARAQGRDSILKLLQIMQDSSTQLRPEIKGLLQEHYPELNSEQIEILLQGYMMGLQRAVSSANTAKVLFNQEQEEAGLEALLK